MKPAQLPSGGEGYCILTWNWKWIIFSLLAGIKNNSKKRFIGSEFITHITVRAEDVLLGQDSGGDEKVTKGRGLRSHSQYMYMVPSKTCTRRLELAEKVWSLIFIYFWFINALENEWKFMMLFPDTCMGVPVPPTHPHHHFVNDFKVSEIPSAAQPQSSG